VKRYWQKPVAPVDFPPALRAKLARPNWSMADRFAREAIFAAYRPKIALALAQDHVAVAGDVLRSYVVHGDSVHGRVCDTWRDAAAHTRGQHSELQRAHLSRAFDEEEVRTYADNYARTCSRMLTLEHRADFARSLGVEPPAGRHVTRSGACARMDDPQWWRRRLRAAWTRRAENVMREIGIVRKGREPYASDDAVMARAQMKAKGRKFLESHVAVNEGGEQLELLKLAEHSLANPALRRKEFMTRVRGFEEIAADAGHMAQFWTLTAPSAFHAQLSSGSRNPNFARGVVRDAQAWLCKQWARVRAKLKRLSILIYGFRIAEPHHDATPHWHMLIFCRPRDAGTIETVVRGYWLSEYADEKGAREHRAKCIDIDSSQGSAAGYVAKYVSKNIDGAGAIGEATDEETGGKVESSVRRVDAWASLHGIRQFQQIGGPPVGLWRELRRLTETSDDPEIERARRAADRGDWRGFCYGVSSEGVAGGRRTHVRLAREETGELTKYAEERPAPVVGVRCTSVVEITRPHLWRITRKGSVHTSGRHAANSGNCAMARAERLCANDQPAPGAGSPSFPGSFSDLGPVAITVRGGLAALRGVRWPNKPEVPDWAARAGPNVH
jgi:hypothetical protein